MSWVFVQLLPPSAGPETRWPGRELAADVDLGHCRQTDSIPCRPTLLSQASKQFLCSQPWWPPPEKEKEKVAHLPSHLQRHRLLLISLPSLSLCATSPCYFLHSRWALADERGHCAPAGRGAHTNLPWGIGGQEVEGKGCLLWAA